MIVTNITSLVYLTLGVIIMLLGLVILNENFHRRINRYTSLMMFFAGTGSIFGAFGLLLKTTPPTQINIELFHKIFLIWEFFFPQMLLFSLVFPQETKWAKDHPRLLYLIFIPHIIHFLLVLSFSSPEEVQSLINLQALSDRFGLIIQPIVILLGIALSLLSIVYEFHTNFFALVNLIYIIAAIALMVVGYRSLRNPRLKKQVGLVLWGIRASVGLYAIAFIFPKLHIVQTSQTVGHLLTSTALLIGTGSIAWAIIRHQFLDIRLIIRRGLIFSLASAILIGLYLLIYNQGKRIMTAILGVEIPILEILFIILALFFFQPILSALERFIEHLFMRDRLDYRNVLQNLSHEIMTTLDTVTLRGKITTILQEAMSLQEIALLIASADGTYSFEKEEKKFTCNPQEEWVQLLKSTNAPIGFDELCIRVSENRSLEKLKKINAYLLIPLIHRENMAGILILSEKESKSRFTTEDMTILSVLSNQAAIALENARLYQEALEKQRIEEELTLAREIQKNLLPNQFPSNDYFELEGFNLPSKEVGGDYYDFIIFDENKIGIAIGDIAGKGIPAAILMSNLQATFRISASQEQNPKEVVRRVNRQIAKTTSAEKYATFFYGVFNTQNLILEYSNAGHNFPILWRKAGGHTLLKKGGLVIGVLKETTYETEQVALNRGDLVLFYTDGITEALNPDNEEFGENRLLETIKRIYNKSAKEVIDNILDTVFDFTHGHMQSDDLTLVALKVK